MTSFPFSVRRYIPWMLFLIIWISVSRCVAPGSISIGKISTSGYTLKNLRTLNTELVVPVENKTNYRLKIRKYKILIYSNGDLLGEVAGKNGVIIPAMTDSLYVVPSEITYRQTLSAGVKTLARFLTRQKMEVEISGRINGYLGIIPFRRKFRQTAFLRRKE